MEPRHEVPGTSRRCLTRFGGSRSRPLQQLISHNEIRLLMRAAGAYPAGPPSEVRPNVITGGQGGASVCTADAASTSYAVRRPRLDKCPRAFRHNNTRNASGSRPYRDKAPLRSATGQSNSRERSAAAKCQPTLEREPPGHPLSRGLNNRELTGHEAVSVAHNEIRLPTCRSEEAAQRRLSAGMSRRASRV
jgi:hypothetical protein